MSPCRGNDRKGNKPRVTHTRHIQSKKLKAVLVITPRHKTPYEVSSHGSQIQGRLHNKIRACTTPKREAEQRRPKASHYRDRHQQPPQREGDTPTRAPAAAPAPQPSSPAALRAQTNRSAVRAPLRTAVRSLSVRSPVTGAERSQFPRARGVPHSPSRPVPAADILCPCPLTVLAVCTKSRSQKPHSLGAHCGEEARGERRARSPQPTAPSTPPRAHGVPQRARGCGSARLPTVQRCGRAARVPPHAAQVQGGGGQQRAEQQQQRQLHRAASSRTRSRQSAMAAGRCSASARPLPAPRGAGSEGFPRGEHCPPCPASCRRCAAPAGLGREGWACWRRTCPAGG